MESSLNRRIKVAEYCALYDAAYAKLVAPVNAVLMLANAELTETSATVILKNLKDFHDGKVWLGDCHNDESVMFLNDSIAAFNRGDVKNGTIELFGSTLNFALYLFQAMTLGGKNIDPAELTKERLQKLINGINPKPIIG